MPRLRALGEILMDKTNDQMKGIWLKNENGPQTPSPWPISGQQKALKTPGFQGFSFDQGKQDSNPHERFWSSKQYHYASLYI